ncbi:unnamed protein product, partial [marine sediment metagenome]
NCVIIYRLIRGVPGFGLGCQVEISIDPKSQVRILPGPLDYPNYFYLNIHIFVNKIKFICYEKL